MLNHELVEKLYKDLSEERKKEFLKALFGNANQSLAYFKRVKDTMLSKMEIMADFFDVPMDILRADCKYTYDHRTKKIRSKASSNNPAGSDAESKAMEKVEELTQRNKFLEECIKLKEERIELLLAKIEMYKEKYEK